MFDTMVDDTIREAVARQTQGIPAGLDEMEPGPFLGIVLSGIKLDRLCGDDIAAITIPFMTLTTDSNGRVTYATTYTDPDPGSTNDNWQAETIWASTANRPPAAPRRRPLCGLTICRRDDHQGDDADRVPAPHGWIGQLDWDIHVTIRATWLWRWLFICG